MSYFSMTDFSIIFPLTTWSPTRSLSSLNKILYIFITRVAFFSTLFVQMNLVRVSNNYSPDHSLVSS
jgi:hypothetical protein